LERSKTVKELLDELGEEKVIADRNVVGLYSREPDGLTAQAEAVVFPSTPQEVSRVVATCYANDTPIYPQGSSSSLSGNAVPLNGGIVLSLERMSSILDVSLVDSTTDVEPGVRIDDLNVELSKRGYMFPVDPASQAVATVGGSINNGAGGMRGAKYGTMKDWVNGLEVVLADEAGTRLELGCRTVKCREGYDLVRLIVGSEGTLAVVTRATLRIAPLPEKVVTALAFFDDIEPLMKAYISIKSSRVQPYIAEFMDAPTVEMASQAVSLPFEAKGNMLLVSLESTPESSERHLRWLEDLMRSSGARGVYTAESEAEAEPLYQLRRSLFPAQVNMFRREGRPFQLFIEDIVVPPSRVPDAIRALRSLDSKYGIT